MKKIFVAGHNGMVGSALCRKIKLDTSISAVTQNRSNLNLTNQEQVHKFLKSESIGLPNKVFASSSLKPAI